MTNFFIEKLIVTGPRKEPAILKFSKGLNIICGPSDTGKSYVAECIDYLFGSEKIRFDQNTGYNNIKMIVATENGRITLERQLNTKKILVSSTDHSIESGYYGIDKQKNNISDLWLRLIGVNDEHHIIKNSRFDKQRLTWRTFLHMFFVKESNVFQEPSIIMPKQNTAITASLSALLFLMTGKDFANEDPREEKKVKEVRKKAVADYINKRLSIFADRKSELDNFPISDIVNLQEEIEVILDEISKTEKQIIDSIKRSKLLLNDIFTTNEQLTECNTLYSRYQSLKTQYTADIKRLTFIAEGELHSDALPLNSKCPFCEGDIPPQEELSFLEASHAEMHRIQLQLNDLLEAERDLVAERSSLKTRINSLSQEKSAVETLLNNELKPKVAALKYSLAEYRRAIEIQNEATVIHGFESSMKKELYEALTEDTDSEIEFKVKNHFDSTILNVFDKYLNKILDQCKYDGFSSAYLSPNSFDVFINGKSKDSFGKGYRAFLNTVLAIALMEYLREHGQYSPNLLIIDSPILSLKERGDEKASDTMKSALFQYLLDNQNSGQVLIIENSIPSLDYRTAQINVFTKDATQGRYGFLHDVR